MSASCLQHCKPGDVIHWKTGHGTRVLSMELSAFHNDNERWPTIATVDYDGFETGGRVIIRDGYLRLITKIVKTK